MTQQTIVGYHQRQRIESAAKVFGFCLPLLAVIAACCISLSSQMPIPIAKPVVFVLASFSILVPFKSTSANTLQKVVVFYLVGVLVNELVPQYFPTPLPFMRINVSYSTVVLFLCAIGYFAGRVNSTNTMQSTDRTNILRGWILALAILIIHMAALGFALYKFYGYGYERNLSVVGNLCLYFLLFLLLWDKLDKLRFRQCLGLILGVYYLTVTVANA